MQNGRISCNTAELSHFCLVEDEEQSLPLPEEVEAGSPSFYV
jgi:hypothetical protein